MKLRIDTTAVKWNKTIDDPMEAGTKNIFVKRKKEEEEDEDFHLKKSEKVKIVKDEKMKKILI